MVFVVFVYFVDFIDDEILYTINWEAVVNLLYLSIIEQEKNHKGKDQRFGEDIQCSLVCIGLL